MRNAIKHIAEGIVFAMVLWGAIFAAMYITYPPY